MTAPVAATGLGLPVSLGATAATGAGAEVVRQGLGNWMLGDAATLGLNEDQVINQGALSLISPWWHKFLSRQGVGPAVPPATPPASGLGTRKAPRWPR